MAVKLNNNVINIYGDNLESCLYARYLANKHPDKLIIHRSTGKFGGIYNESTGMLGILTQLQVDKILEYIEFDFEPITEVYVKIPYSKVKFRNTSDGNIRFPFNKKSFESEYDYDDTVLSTPTYEDFLIRYKQTKNIVKCLKEVFSDDFYVDIVKKIGTNFFNITQSQLDPKYIYKHLLHLESLNSQDYIIQYTPKYGYTLLCEELLNCINIEKIIEDRPTIRKQIRANNELNYIFEYYDYYMDFIFGAIEYVKYDVNLHKTTLFRADHISKTITPYDKKYGQYIQIESNIYGVVATPYEIISNSFESCTPLPTYTNVKKIQEYNSLINNIPNIKMFY